MKKIVSCIMVLLILGSFVSCDIKNSLNSVMKLGDSQKSSNVISIDSNYTEPLLEEKGYYGIGDVVEDKRFSEGTGIQLSYKVNEAVIYNEPTECGIDVSDITMYEFFCESDGTLSEEYDFLVLEIEISCTRFNDELNIRPNITRFSSVGVSSDIGTYEPVSVEQLYFSVNGSVKSADSKDYFYYDIVEGETICVISGWMIPSNVDDDMLFLSIGSVNYSSDSSASDDSVLISLS